jgi:aspartate carbamoyltransferase regulatory subunit
MIRCPTTVDRLLAREVPRLRLMESMVARIVCTSAACVNDRLRLNIGHEGKLRPSSFLKQRCYYCRCNEAATLAADALLAFACSQAINSFMSLAGMLSL